MDRHLTANWDELVVGVQPVVAVEEDGKYSSADAKTAAPYGIADSF